MCEQFTLEMLAFWFQFKTDFVTGRSWLHWCLKLAPSEEAVEQSVLAEMVTILGFYFYIVASSAWHDQISKVAVKKS